jgi:hypothetical protein
MNEMSGEEMTEVMERCLFREYAVGIENKNMRLLVRSIDPIEGEESAKNIRENLKAIKDLL